MKKTNTIFFGGLDLPQKSGTEHFCFIGAPGAGKTKLLQLLMQSVLPPIGSGLNRRAVIFDAKRDFYSILVGMGIKEERIKILNPLDKRCHPWDMHADILDPANANEIATILVPEKGEREPFFPEACRAILGGIMGAFILLCPPARREKWTLRDVVLALRNEDRQKLILGLSEHTRHIVEHYLSGTDTHRDIVASIANVMTRLAFVAAMWEHTTAAPVSLSSWVKDESILLLGSSPTLSSTIEQINCAFVHRLTQIVLLEPEADRQKIPPQTWVIIDELRRAGRLTNLADFLVEGRSKGACVVLSFQDLPGLQEVYNENLAYEMVGTCRNMAFLKIKEVKTAEFASRCLGTNEVERTVYNPSSGASASAGGNHSSTSTSTGLARQRQRLIKPNALPSVFAAIPDASRENGIGGYFDIPSVGNPYPHTLPGDFIERALSKPAEVLNIDWRPGSDQYLREWDAKDLRRLGLEDFPQLLSEKQGSIETPSPREEKGSGVDLLPTADS